MSTKNPSEGNCADSENRTLPSENIRCTLIGDEKVGKSSLLLSYQANTYSSEYIPTVFDIYSKRVSYKDAPINFSLYDIGGNQKFEKLEHHGLSEHQGHQGTDVFLLCFSVDDRKSFENISKIWMHQILNYYILSEDLVDGNTKQTNSVLDPYLVLPIIILVGCKNDIRLQKPLLEEIAKSRRHSVPSKNVPQNRKSNSPIVTAKEAIYLSRAIKAYKYMECCARRGTGIEKIFNEVTKAVLERREYVSIKR